MSAYYERQKKSAAAWVLKTLCTNDLWFDENAGKKNSGKNYLYIPLFDIAQASRSYDLTTLKETCYLLQENNHINIWGDDYDPRAMLVQVSDEGIKAYKKSFYRYDYSSAIKRGVTVIAALAAIIAIVIGVGRFTSGIKNEKYQPHADSKNKISGTSQKSTASLK